MSDTILKLAMTATPVSPQCGEALSLQFTATNETDDMITVESLTFSFEAGKFPTSLAHDFSNVSFTCRQTGWLMDRSGSTFTATPANTQSGQVGPTGLEFDISNIIVNDQPGTTTVKMSKTIGPNKTYSKAAVDLTKTYPILNIRTFHAKDSNILYNSAPELIWEASLGAAITLSSPNGTIAHVKDEPSTPLPSTGSYQLDTPLIQDTNFTLTANANALAVEQGQVTAQTYVSIKPPKAQLNSKIIPDTKPPQVQLEWDIQGATTAQLAAVPKSTTTDIDAVHGIKNMPLVVETTFTVTAQNPVNRKSSSASTTVTPPSFEWANLDAWPADPHGSCNLFSTHAGLMMFVQSYGRANQLYASENGTYWEQAKTNLPLGDVLGACMTHNNDKTYISFYSATTKTNKVYFSTNLQDWSEIIYPVDNSPYVAVSSICFDEAGNLWAFNGVVNPVIYKMPVGAAGTWQKIGDVGFQVSSHIQCFAGRLWLLSGNDYDAAPLIIQSSPDGITWTNHIGPTVPPCGLSMSFAVYDDHLCLFCVQNRNADTPTFNAEPVPFSLWRIDASGNWTQDTPVPDVMLKPYNTAPDVACSGGSLFAVGSGYTSPESDIWVRNT
jgi:hypothetical protein